MIFLLPSDSGFVCNVDSYLYEDYKWSRFSSLHLRKIVTGDGNNYLKDVNTE